MPVNGIFDTTISLLGKSMDLRAQNHNRLSANIANAETPGYTPTSLSFEKELKEALREESSGGAPAGNARALFLRGDETPFDLVQGTVVAEPSGTVGRDGNGVELESEMGRMATNQIMYNADVQLMTKKFEVLKLAIKGGN